MSRSVFGGLVARRLCLAILAGLAVTVTTRTATATPIITGLHKTGTQYPIGGPGGQDSYWEVYAFPTIYTGPLTAGYQAWVFWGGAPVNNVKRKIEKLGHAVRKTGPRGRVIKIQKRRFHPISFRHGLVLGLGVDRQHSLAARQRSLVIGWQDRLILGASQRKS